MNIKYFDNAATTKISEEVLDEMMPFLKNEYGNPSSMYGIGRSAKKAVEQARKKVANLINCDPSEIIFTGSGSESDNTAIKSIASVLKNSGNHIITSKIEHHAILESCKELEKQGFKITYLNVSKDGYIDLGELKKEITKRTILISIMTANNEIGTIQPVREISKIAKENNIIFHTDAVQAVGNIPIDVKEMGIDMLSLSGHKIHAPKGIGALYVRNKIHFKRFIDGGHQEKNRRAGTENVASIVGLGKACEISKLKLNEHMQKLEQLRDYCISQIEKNIKYVRLNGSLKNRLPGNVNISFQFIEGEAMLLNLDQKGICASSGSACTTGDSNPSHVLKALGLKDEIANGALRLTFSEENTKEDIDYLVKNLIEIVNRLRETSPEYEKVLKSKGDV